jgi:uncharacterized RDD family membrane protein YckC
MNSFLLQRLTYLALLPLCAVILAATARAEDPPEASVTPHAWHAHRGNDLVNIGHDSNLPRGQQADSVVSIFGSSTSEGDSGDVVSILGDTRITGETTGNAVAVLGNVYVDGRTDGDVVAVLGNLELGPHAEIGGNVVAVGGTLQRDSAAIVHGNVQNIFAGNFGNVRWLRTWIHHCLLYGRPLALAPGLGWAWGLAFAFLALYAALALLFREGLTRCVQTFEAQPGQTVLAALIAMLLTPVLVVLLFVTVIGIAAVPFVLFGLFCAGLFGKAVMLAWLGRRVTSGHGAGPMSHPAVWVLVGGIVVLALYLVPVLGFLVYKLLGLLGLGAVAYTVILAARAHQAAKGAPRSDAGAAADANAASSGNAASSAGAAADPLGSTPGTAAGAVPRDPAPAGQTPPITAAMPRAGFWIRMVALFIDALLVGVILHMLHEHHLHLLVLAAYGAVMWKLRGSTVGGIVFDLRVVRLDGRAVDWETSIVRALGCFLSLAVAGLGFIWIAFDANNQAWHDKIAGTVVVRVAKGAPLV